MLRLLATICFCSIVLSFSACSTNKSEQKGIKTQANDSSTISKTVALTPIVAKATDTGLSPIPKPAKAVANLAKKLAPSSFVGVDIQKYREELRYGGTTAKALSLAGEPKRKKAFANQQIWFYEKKCYDSGFNKQCIRFVIIFVNGKCASVTCNDNLYYN